MNTNTPTTVPAAPTAPAAPAPVPETSEPLPQTPPSPPVPPATGEPYPGFHREKAALDARVEAFRRAAANPVPGPLRAAYAAEPPSLHGFTLQPVTLGLHPLLVQLGSPLLELTRIVREEFTRVGGIVDEAAAIAAALKRIAVEVRPEIELLVETVFVFTRPVAELRFLLAAGREIFREVAMREIADRLHPVQFDELQQLVSQHYAASFDTALSYAPPAAGPGPVFTKPPAPAPATASAGGSTFWARLCAIFR